LGRYVVKGGCRHLCDRRDIIKKSDQSDTQEYPHEHDARECPLLQFFQPRGSAQALGVADTSKHALLRRDEVFLNVTIEKRQFK
jgi:hypothetical protein